ncbi:hypothetical protein RugamoR64_61850 [Duganella rhizosphaerae]|uniref:hypothetical protein n=1 Tax=Duganella rhizosphaerae TaxID=2885763 RepID=UPI0030E8CBCF
MKSNDLKSAAAPVPTIYVGEELTLCPSCGTRTELLAIRANNVRREGCTKCGQQYDVVDDES